MIINKHNIDKYIKGTLLYCSNIGLTSIEDIPDHITKIYCYSNKLTQLPKLPDSLITLDCYNNKLVGLPKLPDSLEYLNCNSNNLNSYTEGDPHSGYPNHYNDKQWMINHNKLLNRINIINKINEIR